MSNRDHTHARDRAEPRSVLVVEDNRPNRILMEALLTGLGCEPTLAGSGAEALVFAERHRFDLIFMDIHMLDMDGIETLRRLRAGNGANADTPVVALTAHVDGDDHEAFLAAGVAAVLVKPISATSLAAVINEFAGRPATPPDPGPSDTGPPAA